MFICLSRGYPPARQKRICLIINWLVILRAGVETKKETEESASSWVPSGILSLSLKRLRRLRTQGSHPTGHKKSPELTFETFRVPSGIRTHDIQNHNLTL